VTATNTKLKYSKNTALFSNIMYVEKEIFQAWICNWWCCARVVVSDVWTSQARGRFWYNDEIFCELHHSRRQSLSGSITQGLPAAWSHWHRQRNCMFWFHLLLI